jgi:tRNA_anti-like
MKLYIKITLFVVLFIAIAGIWYTLHMFNLQHPDTAKVKPDFIVSATALQKEFEDNETTASARYIKKILEVTGNIVSVTPADSAHTNVSLKTGSDLSSVICTFKSINDPSKFKTGEEITLRGECSGFLMDVLLNNCAVIQNKK